MRQPLAIDPKRLVVSHSVYDESLTFPVADRMSVVTRSYVLRMLFRTHIDEAPGVRATDIENVHTLQFRQFRELDAIRRDQLARPTRRLTSRVRLKGIVEAIIQKRPGPRLERNLAVFRIRVPEGVWTSARSTADADIRHGEAGIHGQPQASFTFYGSEVH